MFGEFPGDAKATGPGTTFWEPLMYGRIRAKALESGRP